MAIIPKFAKRTLDLRSPEGMSNDRFDRGITYFLRIKGLFSALISADMTTDGFVSGYYSWSSERKGLAGMPKQLKSVGTNQFFMQ